ncbi:MAG: Flp pilus assembly protein CpaB [Sphingomonadaceae bacterium]|uniref:Flp pilus assembly protein CpaB n=1 Tax=Thermaurantiacus sp. TaxID=2820283 RepID=UPI00298F2EA3|nr:Flp pilus assembly protein CpaB [Thermaurantiacus sp.]MCS6987734.1 Flp pilus assembly protein CpaB [Sphingomonadaceae bacterium]MDW8415046.1 Flp pilus assembly protein CpaB [Thermaurantiacus sp.]
MDLRHDFRPVGTGEPGGRRRIRRLSSGVLLVALGLVLVGSGVLVAARWLEAEARRRAATLAAPVALAPLWVAAIDIPADRAFDPDDVRLERWPATALPAGRFMGDRRALEALAGRRLRADLPAGAPLLAGHFEDEARGSEPGRPAVGRRALTLPAADLDVPLNLLSSGDRVDVIFSGSFADGGRVAETVIAGARVLGIETAAGPGGLAGGATAVTLEVTPAEAEALALLNEAGRLTLALRAKDDRAATTDRLPLERLRALAARLAVPRPASPLGAPAGGDRPTPTPPGPVGEAAEPMAASGDGRTREGGVEVIRGAPPPGSRTAEPEDSGA